MINKLTKCSIESKKKTIKSSKNKNNEDNAIYPCTDFNFKITTNNCVGENNGIITNLIVTKNYLEMVNQVVRLTSNTPMFPYNTNRITLGIPLTFYTKDKMYSVVIPGDDRLKENIVCEGNNKNELSLKMRIANEYIYITIKILDINDVIVSASSPMGNTDNGRCEKSKTKSKKKKDILLNFLKFNFELIENENIRMSGCSKPIMWKCHQKCDSNDNYCSRDYSCDYSYDRSCSCETGNDDLKTMNFGKHYNTGSLVKKNSGDITYPFFKVAGSSSIENSSVSMCTTNDGEYVYITGFITGTHNNNQDFIDFAGVQQKLKGNMKDIFVAKLNKSGQQICIKTAGCFTTNISADEGCSIAITKSNDFIYVSGFLTSEDNNEYFDFTNSLVPKTMKSEHDSFVAKLSSDLDQLFFVTASGTFEDAKALISAHDDFVYVGGVISGNTDTFIDYGGNVVNTKGNNYTNIFVAKIDGTGTQIFIKVAGTFLFQIINSMYSISSSPTGEYVFVTGSLSGTPNLLPLLYNDFSDSTMAFSGKGKSFNCFVAKLDGTGTQIFFKTMGTDKSSITSGQSVKTKCFGNDVYVTGLINFGGNDGLYYDFTDDGILHKLKATTMNVFVAKLDHSGNQIFFNSAGGNGDGLSGGYDIDIVSKITGDIVYVTGIISGDAANKFYDFSNLTIPRILKGPSGANVFVARLCGNTGQQIFFKTSTGILGVGISVNASCSGDYVNITGYAITIAGYYDFSDSNILLSSQIGGLGIFAAKLTSMGEQIYYKLAGALPIPNSSINPSTGNQIITTHDGFVYVTGLITTAFNKYFDFAGNQKYVQEDGAYAFIAGICNPDYIIGLTISSTDRCGNTSFITENSVICRKKLGLDKNKYYYWDPVEQKITYQKKSSCCDNVFIGFTDNSCKFIFKTF